jgi:hypothetical protein
MLLNTNYYILSLLIIHFKIIFLLKELDKLYINNEKIKIALNKIFEHNIDLECLIENEELKNKNEIPLWINNIEKNVKNLLTKK